MVRIFHLMLILLYIYIYIYIYSANIPPIIIINRIYETQNLLSLYLVSFLVGLRTYQPPCTCYENAELDIETCSCFRGNIKKHITNNSSCFLVDREGSLFCRDVINVHNRMIPYTIVKSTL